MLTLRLWEIIIVHGVNGQSIGSNISDANARAACVAIEVAHWATSVALLQVVDNWPHKLGFQMKF